jgi:hypothetical protein
MDVLFGGVRAPSALGSHLRCYTWGNVAQLEKAGREFLAELTGRAPLLPGAETLAFVDIDSMQKRVYGHKKQGARFGHTKIQGKSLLVRGLNALAAIVSTPLSAPVIAATRLRGGNAASARGAASLATQAVHQAADPRARLPLRERLVCKSALCPSASAKSARTPSYPVRPMLPHSSVRNRLETAPAALPCSSAIAQPSNWTEYLRGDQSAGAKEDASPGRDDFLRGWWHWR